jgi:hypothetical protein
MTRSRFGSLSTSVLRGTLVVLALVGSGCDKDKPKADESKKAESTPVPSGMVFNDFLPSTGSAAGLGVRDSGIEGGLAEVAGEPGEPGQAEPGEKVSIKVTEPGGEPRALRKYSFTANKVEKRVLTITQAVSQTVAGQTSPPQEVTIKISLDLTPKQVKPTGATVEAKVTKVELPGAPPQAAQMLASLNGLMATFDVTSHGEVGEVSFAGSPQMKNQLAESVLGGVSQGVQLLLTPLPTVPIGVGAKWELAAKGEAEQGAKRFTLREVGADSGIIDTDIEVKIPRRAQQSPRGGGMMFVEVDGKGKYTQNARWNGMTSKSEGELTMNEKIEVPDPKGGAGKQTLLQTQKARQVIETPGAGK